MALGRARAVALVGLTGHLVDVEADISSGLPAFHLVGLPDTALHEARERVRAALSNARVPLPGRRITVNLSPAGLPKAGTGFDLAIAASLLAAGRMVDAASVAGTVHLGELGLDGRIAPVRGVLPAVMAALARGCREVVVPWANADEAALVPRARVIGVRSLSELLAHHRGEVILRPWVSGTSTGVSEPGEGGGDPSKPDPAAELGDLREVLGQSEARFGLEVAAAGAHHMLLIGPPGAGKTMLAMRLPGLLPDLELQQALEVTAVHSIAGSLAGGGGLIRRPPFEAPHHTASAAALVGGGSGLPRPGAASRAHRGVLFLDEATEFDSRALDALRQPLEHGELVIHRSSGSARFPARFQLVLAANPCPCGQSTGKALRCTCSSLTRRRYFSRLSGPLLDRVDIQVEVLAVTRAEMASTDLPESSAEVAARVSGAREAQSERLRGTGWVTNGEVPGSWLRGALRLPPPVTRELDRAVDRGTITARGYDRILRLAWSISDLAGAGRPTAQDVDAAVALRHRAAHP